MLDHRHLGRGDGPTQRQRVERRADRITVLLQPAEDALEIDCLLDGPVKVGALLKDPLRRCAQPGQHAVLDEIECRVFDRGRAVLAEVDRALAEGEVVGIFPEGAITRSGEILPFRAGIERILAARAVPVVPIALRGLWGSLFSRKDTALGRARLPRRFWSHIAMVVGDPVPPAQASAAVLEAKVRELRGDWA